MESLTKAIEEITKKGGEIGGILCHPNDESKFSFHGIPYFTSKFVVEGNAILVEKYTFDCWVSGKLPQTKKLDFLDF